MQREFIESSMTGENELFAHKLVTISEDRLLFALLCNLLNPPIFKVCNRLCYVKLTKVELH